MGHETALMLPASGTSVKKPKDGGKVLSTTEHHKPVHHKMAPEVGYTVSRRQDYRYKHAVSSNIRCYY
jgi:hypothetical protein